MAEFDVLLWGATGFTGRLVATYLADNAPPDLRWAIGGRNRDKLERVRAGLAGDVGVVVADALDRSAIEAVARRTRVIASTVGPYAKYGTPLVEACALHGVDYCDLTAEVQWIRDNIDRLHEPAVKNGARIVHCCGFDSIPSDLGVLTLHERLQAQHGQKLSRATLHVTALRGGFSGGTIASLMNLLAEASRDRDVRRLVADPYALNPGDERKGPDGRDRSNAWFDDTADRWIAPFLMAPINTRVVRRSNAIGGYPYGREFRYDEAMAFRKRTRAKVMSGILKTLVVGGSIAPTRALLRLVLPRPGDGPSARKRAEGFFKMRLHGQGDGPTPVSVVGRVEGRQDPGYAETAKMLAESALCLAQDELPAAGGILTPASAMGMQLVERLRRADLTFEVEERYNECGSAETESET